MEKCSKCLSSEGVIYRVKGEDICGRCFNKQREEGRLNKRKITKLDSYEMKITPKKVKEIMREVKNGGELTIPLRRIRIALQLEGEDMIYPNVSYKPREIVYKEYCCGYCKHIFTSSRYAKYCSKRCRRKVNNQKFYDYHNRMMRSDWQYALKTRLRWNLKDAIRYYLKTKKIRKPHSDYIDYEKIIHHLGPCPGRRREWHIDHIKPLYAFDFSNPRNIRKAFAPENLQWLKAKENLFKGRRQLLSNEKQIA